MSQLIHIGGMMGPKASSAPAALLPETQALIAQMNPEPSAALAQVYNTFYAGFLAAGFVLSQFRQYCLAAESEQNAGLELGNPGTNSLSAVNSPTFTANTGYQGDGATSYLSTGIAANSLQPHSIGIASPDSGSIAGSAIGATVDNTCNLAPRNGSGNIQGKIANSTGLNAANSDGSGVIVLTKNGTNTLRGLRYGTTINTQASGADSYGAETLVILRAAGFTTRRVSFAFFGPFLTPTEVETYATLVQTLCNAINPGLIPA